MNLLTRMLVKFLLERGSADVFDVVREFEVHESTAHAALALLVEMKYVYYIHVDKRRLYDLTPAGKESKWAKQDLPLPSDSPIPTWQLLVWDESE